MVTLCYYGALSAVISVWDVSITQYRLSTVCTATPPEREERGVVRGFQWQPRHC